MRIVAALCLAVVLATGGQAQNTGNKGTVQIHVTDGKGTPLWKANVYTREILPQPGDPMRYIGETDRSGMLALPADSFDRDVIVFNYSFLPWVGAIRGTPSGARSFTVRMRQAPCTSPGTHCTGDWDVFGPPKRNRR